MCKGSNVFSRPVLIGRGLDLNINPSLCRFEGVRAGISFFKFPVTIARGKYLFPFRTEKSSLSTPMVLHGRPCGRVGSRRDFFEPASHGGLFFRPRPPQPFLVPVRHRNGEGHFRGGRPSALPGLIPYNTWKPPLRGHSVFTYGGPALFILFMGGRSW
jgi:hypothetical protein